MAPSATVNGAGGRTARLACTPLLRAAIALADGASIGRRGIALRPRGHRPYQVLVYHRVNDEGGSVFPGVPTRLFARQMEILARGWDVYPLEELVGRAIAGETPPRAAAITFDDGYRDNYEHAFPILRRLGLPATIFIATGPVERGTPLWHDRVFAAFEETRAASLDVDGRAIALDRPEGRDAALRAFLDSVRRGPGQDLPTRVDALVGALLDREPEPPAYLRWDDVAAMAAAGIGFGAHTVTHPILTRLPLARALEEARASRAVLEARLGGPVRLFAYPNGTPDDMNDALRDGLRESGFLAAFTTVWGTNDASTDPFALRRVGFWGENPDAAAMRLAWYRLTT